MVTTLSILSLDQGKLTPKGETEDQYYARFMKAESMKNGRTAWAALRLLSIIWRKAELTNQR